MKTVRMSTVLASLAGAASLLLMVPASLSASVGQGWDTFKAREGEPISAAAYQGTSMGAGVGQGFDAFAAGDGVRIGAYEKAYMGTSLGSSASSGWDVFHAGDGDPLP
ncbi:MAG: hypothetical protein LDL19_05040 [Thiobacillus sp.]|nr:hypothetical protein [Thiobacillus sp.]